MATSAAEELHVAVDRFKLITADTAVGPDDGGTAGSCTTPSTVPAIETILLNRLDLPSVGAGGTPIIAIAPAIANALFNATQARLRSLPIRNAVVGSA